MTQERSVVDNPGPSQVFAAATGLPLQLVLQALNGLDDEAIRLLPQFVPQIPVVAHRLGLSVTGLILSIIARGRHGLDNRLPVSRLDPTVPMHLAARRASFGVAFLTSADVLSFSGNEARLVAAAETMDGAYKNELRVPTAHPATAFLVSPQHAVTAGHAVCFRDPAAMHLVFGFTASTRLTNGGTHYVLDREHVVRVKRLIALRYDERLGDIALMELERHVPHHIGSPLPLAPAKSTKLLQEVAALSHARAQPMKAIIRSVPPRDACFTYPLLLDETRRYIGTNLDTYRGSSGSPVIDALGRVIGVQVRGLTEQTGGHEVPYSDLIAGSWATRIELLRDALAGIGVPLRPA
ncbi:MAG: hypothetical protein AMXMBFR59_35980 [Rhodanobacteraceae bacterium]